MLAQVLGLRKGRLQRLDAVLMLSAVLSAGDTRICDLLQFRRGRWGRGDKRIRTDALELEGEHETLSTVL